jgi:hypothetical protein
MALQGSSVVDRPGHPDQEPFPIQRLYIFAQVLVISHGKRLSLFAFLSGLALSIPR